MQEDAHAAASAALASPAATTRHPLTAALLAQRHATERLVAAIGAVLHYTLSHLEILAALGHLVLETEREVVLKGEHGGEDCALERAHSPGPARFLGPRLGNDGFGGDDHFGEFRVVVLGSSL